MTNPAFDEPMQTGTSGESGDGDGDPGDGDGEPGDGDGESGDGDGDGEPGDGDGEPGDGDGEPGCALPLSECSGACVNLDSDLDNCGECGALCSGTCEGGECAEPEQRLVFVTSGQSSGSLGGLEGADSWCMELATNAGLPGEFKAWLSSAQLGPAGRMTHFMGPYRLTTGVLIANDWIDLTDGSLAHAIDRDEHGLAVNGNFVCEGNEVWSNTKPDGTPQSLKDCSGWLDAGPNNTSNTGRFTSSDMSWTLSTCETVTCATPLPIYCVQQ